MSLTRRHFMAAAASAMAATMPATSSNAQAVPSLHAASRQLAIDILRHPDHILARLNGKKLARLERSGEAWTCAGVRVSASPVRQGTEQQLPIRVTNDSNDLTYLHIRWEGRSSEGLLAICDHWERAYGDLEWRGIIPDRVMPWYFLTCDGNQVNGYGVNTAPSAFCFWQLDAEGITLTLDLRSGGEPTQLGSRELHACTVVTRVGAPGETIARAGQELCKLMCPTPRLPAGSIFGVNDWNYAYGKNTSIGILRDSDLIASLAPAGATRPEVVIDDGWQDATRFPSMADLASQIRKRNLNPGLWIRPLRPDRNVDPAWLLPDHRFGQGASHSNLALDPTLPEALHEAMRSVRQAVEWGYSFIKHDFSTWELFGRWGSEMHGQITGTGWHFHDRSRTNAEIVRDFYLAIRAAAGEQTTILGCNTVGHIAAGIFESQRIGDDTSGHDWERTRRYGINSLAHRIAQHRSFSHIDPDIVAMTLAVDWKQTSQWMDVVARSGTSLFLSPDPNAMSPEIKSAMKDAMALSAEAGHGFPLHPTSGTTPELWQFASSAHSVQKKYNWCGAEGVSPFPV